MSNTEPFEYRQRIIWTYSHHTNSKTSFKREKHGIFVVMKLEKRYITHGPYQYSTRLAKVHLDGNKDMSIVDVNDLRAEAQL